MNSAPQSVSQCCAVLGLLVAENTNGRRTGATQATRSVTHFEERVQGRRLREGAMRLQQWFLCQEQHRFRPLLRSKLVAPGRRGEAAPIALFRHLEDGAILAARFQLIRMRRGRQLALIVNVPAAVSLACLPAYTSII